MASSGQAQPQLRHILPSRRDTLVARVMTSSWTMLLIIIRRAVEVKRASLFPTSPKEEREKGRGIELEMAGWIGNRPDGRSSRFHCPGCSFKLGMVKRRKEQDAGCATMNPACSLSSHSVLGTSDGDDWLRWRARNWSAIRDSRSSRRRIMHMVELAPLDGVR